MKKTNNNKIEMNYFAKKIRCILSIGVIFIFSCSKPNSSNMISGSDSKFLDSNCKAKKNIVQTSKRDSKKHKPLFKPIIDNKKIKNELLVKGYCKKNMNLCKEIINLIQKYHYKSRFFMCVCNHPINKIYVCDSNFDLIDTIKPDHNIREAWYISDRNEYLTVDIWSCLHKISLNNNKELTTEIKIDHISGSPRYFILKNKKYKYYLIAVESSSNRIIDLTTGKLLENFTLNSNMQIKEFHWKNKYIIKCRDKTINKIFKNECNLQRGLKKMSLIPASLSTKNYELNLDTRHIFDSKRNKIGCLDWSHYQVKVLDHNNDILISNNYDTFHFIKIFDNEIIKTKKKIHDKCHNFIVVETNTVISISSSGNLIFWKINPNKNKIIFFGQKKLRIEDNNYIDGIAMYE